MGSVAEAFVPGVWAADVMLAESDWAMRVCVGSFESERRAEQAANRAMPTLVHAGEQPGVVVTVGGQRHMLIADQVEIMVLTAEARQRLDGRRASEDASARRALAESDYEPVWDNDKALALLLATHGEGYTPRQMGVGVRWMPLDLSHEDELTEIVATGEELPDSLREDLLLEAIADDAIARHRMKD
ncbi:MAG: hypothetical protein EPN61_18385 [Burkholderiaceae bacterium]|nr:MAG: hypothetical protein EPN61_18385 [Burkholderiaceae bacterium]